MRVPQAHARVYMIVRASMSGCWFCGQCGFACVCVCVCVCACVRACVRLLVRFSQALQTQLMEGVFSMSLSACTCVYVCVCACGDCVCACGRAALITQLLRV